MRGFGSPTDFGRRRRVGSFEVRHVIRLRVLTQRRHSDRPGPLALDDSSRRLADSRAEELDIHLNLGRPGLQPTEEVHGQRSVQWLAEVQETPCRKEGPPERLVARPSDRAQ